MSARLRSAIYRGDVVHTRTSPRRHRLRYQVAYFLISLNESSELARVSRWFGINRLRWFSFFEDDHATRAVGSTLTERLENSLRSAGINAIATQFQILCIPRIAGFAFNPITVIFCQNETAENIAVIYEVSNTFGERLSYVFALDAEAKSYTHRCDKALFVSPFNGMAGEYQFRLSSAGDVLDLVIDYKAPNHKPFRAMFHGKRQDFNAPNLRACAWRYPLLSFKVVLAIHFEALKLWFKRIPVVKHVSVGESHIVVGKE